MKIHQTSIIANQAIIGQNVTIGPYTVIGNAIIGDNCVIHPHVVIADGTTIGNGVEIFPGAFLGKEPKGAGVLARQPVYTKTIIIEDECSIGPHAIIYYDVKIGKQTLIGDGASIREQCRIGSQCIISRYVTINYATTIGNKTKIMDNTHITGNASIGSNVFISLLVGTTNDNKVRSGYSDHVIGPTIEDHVVIGVGASLLPGVHLGKGCTVAAGSLVNKDVEAFVTVAGSPARFIKHNNICTHSDPSNVN